MVVIATIILPGRAVTGCAAGVWVRSGRRTSRLDLLHGMHFPLIAAHGTRHFGSFSHSASSLFSCRALTSAFFMGGKLIPSRASI